MSAAELPLMPPPTGDPGVDECQKLMIEILRIVLRHRKATDCPAYVYIDILESVKGGLMLSEAIETVRQSLKAKAPAGAPETSYIA